MKWLFSATKTFCDRALLRKSALQKRFTIGLFSAKEPYVTGLFCDRDLLRKRAFQKRFVMGLFSAKEPYITELSYDRVFLGTRALLRQKKKDIYSAIGDKISANESCHELQHTATHSHKSSFTTGLLSAKGHFKSAL